MASKGKNASWKQNPEAVKEDILNHATRLIAQNGLSGTRVEDIAKATQTSKRMIYYYFDNKESLYSHVLEREYTKVRQGEANLELSDLDPESALRTLIAFTFDHHRKNVDFIRLIMIENIHHGEFMSQSESVKGVNAGAINKLCEIITRGQEKGVFRKDLDPVALHWYISAVSFFNVSNRSTFSALFGDNLFQEPAQMELRDQAADAIIFYVKEKS